MTMRRTGRPVDYDDWYELATERDKLEALNAELLEALERALQYIVVAAFDGGLSQNLIDIAARDLDKARAAISKAKGE